MKTLRRFLISLTAISALGFTLFAQSNEDRRIKVINRASSSIRYFYASNVDRGTWEEDILGEYRVIEPDHYMIINIDDGSGHCLYDFKAVLSDGREAVTRNLNVCTKESWTVTDSSY